ncbi:MAG: hypothetical protein JXR63_11945 [Spirochaetales bacterium]|nr:hypothetical protein [Spirochaetales bacterium]
MKKILLVFVAIIFVSCNLVNGVSYNYDDLDFDSDIWKANKESGEDASLYNFSNPRGKMYDSLKTAPTGGSATLKSSLQRSVVDDVLGAPEREESVGEGLFYYYYLGVWGVFKQHDYLVVFFENDVVKLFFLKRESF